MTTEDYETRKAPRHTLDDLYAVARGIEEKVEEILDQLEDLGEIGRDRAYGRYGIGLYDENGH